MYIEIGHVLLSGDAGREETENRVRLKGRALIVTGAGSGLGREVPPPFAAGGATLAAAITSVHRAEEAAASAKADGFTVLPLVRDGCRRGRGGGPGSGRIRSLDVTMASAGIVSGTPRTPPGEITLAACRKATGTNLAGAFLAAGHAARAVKPGGKDAIVVTSPLAPPAARPQASPEVPGMGGAGALLRAAAPDAGAHGLRVNAICPSQGSQA
jgi:NAD(P)-dependent dehydrogenase (short-subunit alcohol dehydrogenase family)